MGRHAATEPQFLEAFNETIPDLRRFARSLCRNHADAEDLTQTTLAKAWSNAHQFQPGTSMRAWLFTIARNQFFSDCRQETRRRDLLDRVDVELGRATMPDDGFDLDQVRRAMNALPETQREALLLLAVGHSYEDVADMVGQAVGTIKSRVNRARGRLQQISKRQAGQDGVPPSQALQVMLKECARLGSDSMN
jgi:RNA polymerase sigma-70 factor (ECF subfamily)